MQRSLSCPVDRASHDRHHFRNLHLLSQKENPRVLRYLAIARNTANLGELNVMGWRGGVEVRSEMPAHLTKIIVL